MNKDFWKNKTVLITGHTGFKGSWLTIYLIKLGAKVIGYSLEVQHEKDNYNLCKLKEKIVDVKGDIRNLEHLNKVINKYKPDIVFHLAAQALVIDSYKKPIETYETNIMGTLNVLESIKNLNKKVVGIFITSDKCYENIEQIYGYRETDKMGGYDLYSSSKGCCEILINSYRNSFFNEKNYNEHKKDISSVRAGNVIGGGDWSDYRLIPDCIRAYEEKSKIILRNPKSTRPWQHVLEPLSGYLILAQKMYENPIKYSGGYNFGPQISSMITVETIVRKIALYLDYEGLIQIEQNDNYHEANLLFLDTTKAQFILGWKGILNIDEAINLTMDYYTNYKKENLYNLCEKQIDYYMKKIEEEKSE